MYQVVRDKKGLIKWRPKLQQGTRVSVDKLRFSEGRLLLTEEAELEQRLLTCVDCRFGC